MRRNGRVAAQTAETMAYGLAGGLLFKWLGVPAGLISGAIVAVAVAAIAGRPMLVPRPLQFVTLLAIGVALGSSITPEQLRGLISYPASIATLLTATAAFAIADTIYLRRFHGWQRLPALFASLPGVHTQVLITADMMNVDVRGIAVIQMIRSTLLAIAIPAVLALLGHVPPAALSLPSAVASPLSLVVLSISAAGLGLALQKVGMPGGLFLGAIFGAAAAEGFGWATGTMPPFVRDCALVGIGSLIGSRFASVNLRTLLRYLLAAAGSIVVGFVPIGLFILLAVELLGTPVAGTVLAYAPGAIDTSLILALTMNLDPVFVSAHQLARLLGISAALAVITKLEKPDRPA